MSEWIDATHAVFDENGVFEAGTLTLNYDVTGRSGVDLAHRRFTDGSTGVPYDALQYRPFDGNQSIGWQQEAFGASHYRRLLARFNLLMEPYGKKATNADLSAEMKELRKMLGE